MNAPNVILISTDQQRADCIGGAGRAVLTPNIDRIGAAGTRFSKCITPHPMCQPARASILTGKLPYSHGVRDNGRNLHEDYGAEGLGGVFSAAGYDTCFIGKAHLATHETFSPTGRAECYHSTAEYPAEWGGPYFGFQNVQLMLRPHHHCLWQDAPYTLHYENDLDHDGNGEKRWKLAKVHAKPDTSHFQAWRSALEDKWHSSPWIGDNATSLINKQHDAPLFAWISFPDPHPPFLAAAPWSEQYDPFAIDIPEHRVLDLDKRPWWHREFLENPIRGAIKRPHAQDGIDWGQRGSLSDEQLRDITAIYYGMISAIDYQTGRILDALETNGMSENTIVVFISDHGEWLGDHGLLLKGPMLYDGLLRVPCLMCGPGIPAGKVVNDPVSTVDLRSTLADLCKLQVTPDSGASLRGVMQGTESRDFALNEWEVDKSRSGIDMDLNTVRSNRYRMSIDRKTDTGELYDMQEDPHELINLFDEPSHTTVRREHMDMILARPDDRVPVAPRVGWH